MTTITFRAATGALSTLDAEDGLSLMEVATRNGVPGIDADCGGACSCATCLVHVDEPWFARLAAPSETEVEMLGFARELRSTSRLSCQIRVAPELEGLVVETPEAQS